MCFHFCLFTWAISTSFLYTLVIMKGESVSKIFSFFTDLYSKTYFKESTILLILLLGYTKSIFDFYKSLF